MLSGNGRHRRPRQAPALLVAAGVTGSAIAIPLLGAGAASAASGNTWDKVADCASGGSWSENSGNGFYGGLQLSQEDWDKYGGLDYASRPDQASRSQQIAVAEKILDDQGVGAFHTCGLTSGLNEDSSSADVDTGVLGDGSSDSSNSSDSSGLSDSSGSSSSSHSSSSSASSTPSGTPSGTDADRPDNSGTPSGSESSASPSNSQESDSSVIEATKGDDSDEYQQSAGSSSLVDTGALGTGRHRGDSANESVADSAGTSSGRHASYTIRPGDTLASIADSLDLQGGWRELYAENKKAIGADPSHIVPGQTLRVGAEPVEK